MSSGALGEAELPARKSDCGAGCGHVLMLGVSLPAGLIGIRCSL